MPESVRFSLFVLVIHLLTLIPVELPGLSIISGRFRVPDPFVRSWLSARQLCVGRGYTPRLPVCNRVQRGLLNVYRLRGEPFYLGFSPDVVLFAQPTMSLLYVGASGTLSGFVWIASDEISTEPIISRIPNYDLRVLALLVSVPMFAVVGAMFINRYAFNRITLLTIVCIALVSMFVYHFDERGKYYPAAILSLSTALLLQNTIITTYLGRGDGVAEYAIADAVLRNGYWVPGAAKDAMPRIGVLQPAYSLLMDTDLLWTFKLAHPILFAAVPVVTYVPLRATSLGMSRS